MIDKWWINYPWRMIQTNLREIDMADIDATGYAMRLKSFFATVVMINTSGIIANYPTELDFHYQSPFLTGDSLEKIIAACHAAGIRVIARTDFSKIREPIYEQHPDWAFRDADGRIVNYNGDVHVCINSDYQQIYALEIMGETIEKLDIDGIYFNMAGFIQRDYSNVDYGICHCVKCREKFAAFSGGMDLPAPTAPFATVGAPTASTTHTAPYASVGAPTVPTAPTAPFATVDASTAKYKLFQKQVIAEYDKKVFGYLTGRKPELCVSRIGDGGFYRQESNTALDRPLPRWQYDSAENTKYVKSSFGTDMISSNTSVDFLDFPARHTAVSPYQQSLRLYQSLAQGGALDYYMMGRIDNRLDRSGFVGIQSIFRFHNRHEDVYRNDLESNAKIALVKDTDGNVDEYRGWYRALAEGHFLFDTPLKQAISEKLLARYEAVVLPDCEYLSDAHISALEAFVKAGGKLVGVYKTGFGDDKFGQRAKLGLGNCFGMTKVFHAREDMRGSYIAFDGEQYPSLPDTELIYLDDTYIYADYADDALAYGKLTPPQMFGPPERCYPKVSTEYPGAVSNVYGKGDTLYLPWKLGSFYYRQGYSVYLAYMIDLLGFIGIKPLVTNLPEMVEVSSHSAGDGSFELISLVNNSGHYGLSFFEPINVMGCQITAPISRNATNVKSIMTNKKLEFMCSGRLLSVTLPKLGQYDALLIT